MSLLKVASKKSLHSTGRTIKVTYTAGAGIGFNPRSTPDVIAPELIEAVELNLKNPPEDTKH